MENFRSECLREFKNLFKQTQNQNENQFLISLLGIRKEEFNDRSLLTIPYMQEMEFDEVLRATSLFLRIINGLDSNRDNIDRENSLRIKLFTYCHLVEVDFYYNVIGNLLRILANGSYIENLLLDKTLERKRNKLRRLFKECRGNGVKIHLDGIYEKICSDNHLNLRNAFLHSRYILNYPDLVLTKHISTKKKCHYSFDEINILFADAITFVKTFIETYRNAIRPYQQRKLIRIDYAAKKLYIRYHQKSKRWIFAKG